MFTFQPSLFQTPLFSVIVEKTSRRRCEIAKPKTPPNKARCFIWFFSNLSKKKKKNCPVRCNVSVYEWEGAYALFSLLDLWNQMLMSYPPGLWPASHSALFHYFMAKKKSFLSSRKQEKGADLWRNFRFLRAKSVELSVPAPRIAQKTQRLCREVIQFPSEVLMDAFHKLLRKIKAR